MERTRRLANQQQMKLAQLRQKQTTLIGQRYHAEQLAKGPISSGKLAHLRAQVAGWQKRPPRLAEQIAQAERVLDGHQARLMEQEAELARLRIWPAQLETDNNKEMKGVFFVQHLMSHSLAGIRLQCYSLGWPPM